MCIRDRINKEKILNKLMPVLLLVAGCSSQGYTNNEKFYDDPDNFHCPSSHFALCEGHMRTQMECQCVDKQLQRQVLQGLSGW